MTISFSRERCYIIAEVAQAHDGSLQLAHSYIDSIARAGADAVKFQAHIAAAESTCEEPWRVRFSRQDASRYDYWRRMEFTEEQWTGLRQHAKSLGIGFVVSPFSVEAVDLLAQVGVDIWKIASGEVTNDLMLERLSSVGHAMLISTGMSSWAEIAGTVAWARSTQAPFAVLQCASIYPTPCEQVGLNVIAELRDRFHCAVGLSDHSGTPYPALAAVSSGIEVLEVHVTLSHDISGPDDASSLTTQEVAELVRGIRKIECMRANPVDKDRMADELSGMRATFMRSLALREDLPMGTVLARHHLTAKKPATGIPPANLDAIVGRALRRDVSARNLLRLEDLE